MKTNHSIIPSLTVGDFSASSVGLNAKNGVVFEVWYEYGRGLKRVEGALQWIIGDWLNYGESHYGEMYTQAMELWPEAEYQTLANYKWVSSKIQFSTRVENLSWTHHRYIAALAPEDQKMWLDHAQKNDWSSGDLRNAIGGGLSFDYKRDNKSNRAGDAYVPQGYDACQTPAYAIDPLLPFIGDNWTIWEPACGDGLLVEALYDSGYSEEQVIGTDLLTGRNFFECEPAAWDFLLTNPPFSIKYEWLKRCYELGKPFALLVPVETLGSKTAQELMKQYGFEIMLLDSRVDFKMPNKGWGGSAQFPVLWLCWHILPQAVMFGSIEKGKRIFNHGASNID